MRSRNLLIIASLATVFTFGTLSYTGAASSSIGTAPVATTSNQHQRVGGIDVYYGVVPASVADGRHPAGHPEAALPGGAPPGSYYLTVSLIDSRTGQHIPDARVSASVRRGIVHHEGLPLPPAAINHVVSYGNYFTMDRPGTYRIHVSIQRPGGNTQAANFSYQQL